MAINPNPNQGSNVGKMMVAGMASNCIMRVVSFVIVVGLWGLAWWIFSKNHWFVNMSMNIRGPLIIGVFALPLIIIAVIDYYLRHHIYNAIDKQ